MRRIRQKLQSKSGHSMLLAMVFLLVCLFVGGNVLSGAAANAGQMPDMEDQQNFFAQRSALQLMAQMLKESPMELTILDVKVKENGKTTQTVTYGDEGDNLLQTLLYSIAKDRYEKRDSIDTGEIALSVLLPDGKTLELVAKYAVNSQYDLKITFPGGNLHLTMAGYRAVSKPVTLTLKGVTTTTKTTVIRWEAPIIRKGGGS